MDNFNYASCACFEGKNIFLAWTLVWENNFKKTKTKKKKNKKLDLVIFFILKATGLEDLSSNIWSGG